MGWIKKLIRKLVEWAQDEEFILRKMKLVEDGEQVVPIEVVGFHIKVRRKNGLERLVQKEDVEDEEQFQKAWKHLGGGNLKWEDGSDYVPE